MCEQCAEGMWDESVKRKRNNQKHDTDATHSQLTFWAKTDLFELYWKKASYEHCILSICFQICHASIKTDWPKKQIQLQSDLDYPDSLGLE